MTAADWRAPLRRSQPPSTRNLNHRFAADYACAGAVRCRGSRWTRSIQPPPELRGSPRAPLMRAVSCFAAFSRLALPLFFFLPVVSPCSGGASSARLSRSVSFLIRAGVPVSNGVRGLCDRGGGVPIVAKRTGGIKYIPSAPRTRPPGECGRGDEVKSGGGSR